MTWLSVLLWLKNNWRSVAIGGGVLLLLSTGYLWTKLSKVNGELAQCQAEKANAIKVIEATNSMVVDLQTKVKAKCRGSIDLDIDPGTPIAGNPCPPCPKIRLKADCGGENEVSSVSSTTNTATAKITEKPGPGGGGKALDSWSIWAGGGMSLPSVNVYHAKVSVGYHALMAYGQYDNNGAWAGGAQVRLLTWNWP